MAVPMESYAGKIQRKLLRKKRVIEAASGREKADLVLKKRRRMSTCSRTSCARVTSRAQTA